MKQSNETKVFEGLHYATGVPVRLEVSNGRIAGRTLLESAAERTLSADTGGDPSMPEYSSIEKVILAPGLVDLQINGYGGVDLNEPNLAPERLREMLCLLASHGITSCFPTLITGPVERTNHNLEVIARICDFGDPLARLITGIHLEGPFISAIDGPRGAHPAAYCRPPDIALLEEWQARSGGRVRLLTLAPELPGAIELIVRAIEMDIIVAIGHTAATSDQIRAAVDAGARLSTHLGNGCHGTLPRHPNYIWDQLAEDRLFASMIADGFHLPDAVLRVFWKVKREMGILVSDAMPYAGMAPGDYESPTMGRVRLTPEGKLHMAGRPKLLAGSALRLTDAVRHMARITGFTKAWDMASVHPALLLDPEGIVGFREGAPADLVQLSNGEGAHRILATYKGGKEISRNRTMPAGSL